MTDFLRNRWWAIAAAILFVWVLFYLLGWLFSDSGLPQEEDPYFVSADETLQANLKLKPNKRKAKNVVLMVGDGFGISSITAARIYEGQRRGVDGESNQLAFEKLPYGALSKTYAHDLQVSDSASTATAMVSGVKTKGRVLGIDSNVSLKNCDPAAPGRVKSVFALAEEDGRATGVVSTASVTHATPAATYAHSPSRDWESDADIMPRISSCIDIARQLIEWPYGNGLEVVLGGGRKYFLPETTGDPEDAGEKGARKDGRNLIEQWQKRHGRGASFVWNDSQFAAVDPRRTKRLLGLFERKHMQYESMRSADTGGEPSLAEMTSKAIDILSKDRDGFFLLVEGGRIDHASHAGNAYNMVNDAVAFNEAVKTVLAKVDLKNTLVIVTADHSHTLTISGYSARGNPILGVARNAAGVATLASDGKTYTTLGYANGPGAVRGIRTDAQKDDPLNPAYKQQSLVPLYSETHAGEDVAIYAGGPWAHLFQNTVEQNYIFHVIRHASDL